MKKSEEGSVTLIVFATVMLILIILTTILTISSMKNKSQVVETQRLKNVYDEDMGMMYANYANYVGTINNSIYTNTIENSISNSISNQISNEISNEVSNSI